MSLRKLKQFIRELKQTQPVRALQVSNNALALITNRITNEGKDSAGNKLKGYSKKVVPKWFFKGRSRSNGAEKRVQNNPEFFMSYEDFREVNNLQTEHVDLSFTGRMWQNIGVEIAKNQGGKIEIEIKGRNEETQDKINWNSKRYGNILNLSTKEKLMIQQAYEKSIERIKRKYV